MGMRLRLAVASPEDAATLAGNVDEEFDEEFDDDAFDDGFDDGFDAALTLFDRDGVDVDKNWCALDAILLPEFSGREQFWAGEPCSDDFGYGPAMFTVAAEVAASSARLSLLTPIQLSERLDSAIATGAIYYPVWEWDSETRRSVVDLAMHVIAMYSRASASGLGVISLML